jgi:hypothetical protein
MVLFILKALGFMYVNYTTTSLNYPQTGEEMPVHHAEKDEPVVTATPQKREETAPVHEDGEAWGAIPAFLRRHKK